jgi:predicted nicotinamide N-methyase
MPSPSPANLRAFVRRHTRLEAVPDVPGLRLHLAHDVTRVWHAAGEELALDDAPLPYWAFTWSGGLALARYLLEHPGEVAGLTVVDLGAGSGVGGIVAARLGAASVQAADIDPLAQAAIAVNARANDVRIGVSRSHLLETEPPDVDVILAGDVCYQEQMGEQMIRWLRRAAANGSRILIGDPGRAYFPRDLERLATYRVRTSREVEEAVEKASAVYTFPSPSRIAP